MEYFELTYDEVTARLTDKPKELFEPILDELVFYHSHTEEIYVIWDELDITDNDGLSINGYSVHPYAAWRITNAVVGSSKNNLSFWETHMDLWIPLFRTALNMLSQGGKLVVVNNQIVAFSILEAPLGTHLQMLDQLFDSVGKSVKFSKSLITITGLQIDPTWVFVRVLPIGNLPKSQYVGYELDSNYLFKRGFNRASFSHYVRDFKQDIDMSLSDWWSVKGLVLNNNARDFPKAFERKFNRAKDSGMSNEIRKTEALLSRVNKYAETPWKQSIFLKFTNQGISENTLRKASAEFGYGGRLDYCISMLKSTRTFPLDRRLRLERRLANHLKGTK